MEELFPVTKSRPRLTGFIAGLFGTLTAGLFAMVVVYGEGVWNDGVDREQTIIYPNW